MNYLVIAAVIIAAVIALIVYLINLGKAKQKAKQYAQEERIRKEARIISDRVVTDNDYRSRVRDRFK
tara:strand:+ start:289 stop:489 length:201 start_codon:yes stop_codon:yes gene_type:complete